MLSGAKAIKQFRKRALWGTFIRNYFEFGPVVQGEMLFKEKFTDDGWTDAARQ